MGIKTGLHERSCNPTCTHTARRQGATCTSRLTELTGSVKAVDDQISPYLLGVRAVAARYGPSHTKGQQRHPILLSNPPR